MPDETFPEVAPAAGMVAAAAVFYLAGSPIIYVPALLVLALLSWRRLDVSLAIVVLFVPLFMLPKHLGSKEFAPSEIFLLLDLLIAGLWWLSPSRNADLKWDRLLHSPFLAPALLFLVAGALSTWMAADRHQALQAYREVILEPTIFFGLLVLVVDRLGSWITCFAAVIGAGLVVGVIGLVQRATHQDLTRDTGSTILKVHSVYGSPDNVGLLYDRVIPIWLALTLFHRFQAGRRMLWYLAGVVLFATLFLTYSRGAWVAIGITILAMSAIAGRRARRIAILAALLVLAVAAIKGQAVSHALTAGHSGTAQQRLHVWHAASRMIAGHPIFGIGPDNFLHYYAPTRKEDLYQHLCTPGLGYMDAGAGDEPCLSHPHDEFLDFYLSTGILGLISFVWLEITFWSLCIASLRRSQGLIRALLFGTAGAMLAALVHGLVDNGYFLMDLAVLFWLLCGFVSFAGRTSGLSDVPSPHSTPSPAGVRA